MMAAVSLKNRIPRHCGKNHSGIEEEPLFEVGALVDGGGEAGEVQVIRRVERDGAACIGLDSRQREVACGALDADVLRIQRGRSKGGLGVLFGQRGFKAQAFAGLEDAGEVAHVDPGLFKGFLEFGIASIKPALDTDRATLDADVAVACGQIRRSDVDYAGRDEGHARSICDGAFARIT